MFKFKVISVECVKGSQDVIYHEVLEGSTTDVPAKPVALRIFIRSDTYKLQGSARLERWDGTQWHEVHHIEPRVMRTDNNLCYRAGPVSGEDFREDREILLMVSDRILRLRK